jgi:hypothetical protein
MVSGYEVHRICHVESCTIDFGIFPDMNFEPVPPVTENLIARYENG